MCVALCHFKTAVFLLWHVWNNKTTLQWYCLMEHQYAAHTITCFSCNHKKTVASHVDPSWPVHRVTAPHLELNDHYNSQHALLQQRGLQLQVREVNRSRRRRVGLQIKICGTSPSVKYWIVCRPKERDFVKWSSTIVNILKVFSQRMLRFLIRWSFWIGFYFESDQRKSLLGRAAANRPVLFIHSTVRILTC